MIKNNARENFIEFEGELNFLLNDLNEEVVIEDYYLLDDIKHAIMVFAMKDKFNETNKTFLENTKRLFYDSSDKLENRHPSLKWRIKHVKQFMEMYYFNT
jgi:hypothetical protein